MSVTTVSDYVLYTGDATTASALVQANLDVAEQMVEEYLRRELASTERTERVRWATTCRVYPRHTPITSVPSSASYTVEDEATITDVGYDAVDAAVGALYWPSNPPDDYRHNAPRATVTYTGGWTNDTLPAAIKRQVSLIANTLANPTALTQPGVISASVGDVSITRSQAAVNGQVSAIDAIVPMSSAVLNSYRWRPF